MMTLACALTAQAELKLTKLEDTIVDPAAMLFKASKSPRSKPKLDAAALAELRWMTLHAKGTDTTAFHKGYQYVGYYDSARKVCIARRKLPRGKWETIRFNDYTWESNDPHNNVVIGIATGDGTIHMAFDHHVHPLHYRVSRKGVASDPASAKWDASLFGPVKSKLHGKQPGKITYPRFVQTPAGGLQMSYRNGYPGRGVTMLVDYDAETSIWSGTRAVNSSVGTYDKGEGRTSKSRFGYMKGFVYSPDGKLHNTWVWREHPGSLPNHDFMYTYSDDGGTTWYNNAGKTVADLPKLDTPGIIVKRVPGALGISNPGGGNVVDSEGRLHVLINHKATADAKGKSNFHAWRDTDGKWTFTDTGPGGKMAIDGNNNLYLLYLSGGKLNVMGATASSGWTDWKKIHTEPGNFLTDTGRAVTYDLHRLRNENILSVLVQEAASKAGLDPNDPQTASSALHMIDFKFE